MWRWLTNPENQSALRLVGSAVAAVAVAGWAIFTWQYKQAAEPQPELIIDESPADEPPNKETSDPLTVSNGASEIGALLSGFNGQSFAWNGSQCLLEINGPHDDSGFQRICKIEPAIMRDPIRESATEISLRFREPISCKYYIGETRFDSVLLQFKDAVSADFAIETMNNWKIPEHCNY